MFNLQEFGMTTFRMVPLFIVLLKLQKTLCYLKTQLSSHCRRTNYELLSVSAHQMLRQARGRRKILAWHLSHSTFSAFLPLLINFFLSPPTWPQHLFSSCLMHQLACPPPPPPLPKAIPCPPLLSHFSSFLLTFPSFPFFLSLPASPCTLLWAWSWICTPKSLSLGRWFDLWLGKCFEESCE